MKIRITKLTLVAQVKQEQIICNGFIDWNANYVDLHIRLMGQTYGNEGVPTAKGEDLNYFELFPKCRLG